MQLIFDALGAGPAISIMKKVRAGILDIAKATKSWGDVDQTDWDAFIKLSTKAEEARKKIDRVTKAARKLKAEIKSTGTMKALGINDMFPKKKGFQEIGGFVDNLKGKINKASLGMKTFRMEFLGIMFAGMALQRVFLGIAKSVTSTFTKIMESSEMNGSAIQRLGAHWEYLKFTIGSAINSAIGPLMPMITRLIDKFSEWIQKNPKLVTAIILGAVALGTFLMVFGQLALAMNSFSMFADKGMGKAFGIMSKGFMTMLTSIGTLVGATGIGAIVAGIAIVIAIIVVLYAMWKSNFGGMADFLRETFKGAIITAKRLFADLWSFLKNIFGFITALFTGDWDSALVYLRDAFFAALRFIVRLFLNSGMMIVNVFIFTFNLVVDFFFKIVVGGLIKLAELAVRGMLAPFDLLIPGLDDKIAAMSKKIRNGVNSFSDKIHFEFVSADNFQAMNDLVDKIKAPGENLVANTRLDTTKVQAVEKVIDVKVQVEGTGVTGNVDDATMDRITDGVSEKLVRSIGNYTTT